MLNATEAYNRRVYESASYHSSRELSTKKTFNCKFLSSAVVVLFVCCRFLLFFFVVVFCLFFFLWGGGSKLTFSNNNREYHRFNPDQGRHLGPN